MNSVTKLRIPKTSKSMIATSPRNSLTTLKLINVCKAFGAQQVLRDVSLTLERGRVVCLLGGNGSGKTTLLNIASGFTQADSGGISVGEDTLIADTPLKLARLGVGRTFQDLRLITQLSVHDNVVLAATPTCAEGVTQIFSRPLATVREDVDKLLQRFCLAEIRDQKCSDISYGQQKLVTIACAAAVGKQILLLDEPVSGIAPELRKQIAVIVKDLAAEGRSVLLIEHNLDFVRATGDQFQFLANEALQQFSTFQDLANDVAVKRAYPALRLPLADL